MELDLVKLVQDLGVGGGIGIGVFLIFKNYAEKFVQQTEQIMHQNDEAIQYLMDLNKALLQANKEISAENRKALEDNTKIINSLVAELKKRE